MGDGMSDARREQRDHNTWLLDQDLDDLRQQYIRAKKELIEAIEADKRDLYKYQNRYCELSENISELSRAKEIGNQAAILLAWQRNRLRLEGWKPPLEQVVELLQGWGDGA